MLEEQGSCAQQDRLHAHEAERPGAPVTHLPQGILQVTANDFVIAKLPFIHELTNLIAERKGNFPCQENHSAKPAQQVGSI